MCWGAEYSSEATPCSSFASCSVDHRAISQNHFQIQNVVLHCTIPAVVQRKRAVHLVQHLIVMTPYRTAVVPEALVAAIPHSEASAPGSEEYCMFVCALNLVTKLWVWQLFTYWEPQACPPQVVIQPLPGNPWLYCDIEVLLA